MIINSNIILIIVSLLSFSYLIGSFAFGYFAVKFFHGINLQEVGSKNIGATNTWRAGYKILGILTFVFDSLKSVLAFGLAILIIKYFNLYFSIEEIKFLQKYLPITSAAFAIVGHIFSIFLKFKGGKGVSTFFGFLFVGFSNLFFYSAILWIFTFIFKKISALSSLCVMIFSIFYAFLFIEDSVFKFLLIGLSSLIIISHRENIKNLISKNSIEFKKIEKK